MSLERVLVSSLLSESGTQYLKFPGPAAFQDVSFSRGVSGEEGGARKYSFLGFPITD
jgi:hypothetical protein